MENVKGGGAPPEGKEWIWTCTRQPRWKADKRTRQPDTETKEKRGAQKRGEERRCEEWSGGGRSSRTHLVACVAVVHSVGRVPLDAASSMVRERCGVEGGVEKGGGGCGGVGVGVGSGVGDNWD
jgi:hypothetical protein